MISTRGLPGARLAELLPLLVVLAIEWEEPGRFGGISLPSGASSESEPPYLWASDSSSDVSLSTLLRAAATR